MGAVEQKEGRGTAMTFDDDPLPGKIIRQYFYCKCTLSFQNNRVFHD
jgi:hypothetical protein